MVSLALFLTYFIMAPTLEKINNNALQPYLSGNLDNSAFFDETIKPLKSFMIQQIGRDGVQEVALFYQAFQK